MFNIGPEELILILVIALIFLGPAKLPEVARSIGKGLREFRSLSGRAQGELMRNLSLHEEDDSDEDGHLEIPPSALGQNGQLGSEQTPIAPIVAAGEGTAPSGNGEAAATPPAEQIHSGVDEDPVERSG